MFDDDKSVLAFFDHARKRFASSLTRRNPSRRKSTEVSEPEKKAQGRGGTAARTCRSSTDIPRGNTVPPRAAAAQGDARRPAVGRALGKDGKPVADVVRQENYVEDRFTIAVQTRRCWPRLSQRLRKTASRSRSKLPASG